MKDLYNLHSFYSLETHGKNSKKPESRGKSFGYQVLGFGSGVAAAAAATAYFGGRGIYAGGTPSVNIIQYITIASLGNATDFGNLIAGGYMGDGCSNGSRGCFGGRT